MSAFTRRQVLKAYQLVTGRHVLDCLDELNRTQWLSYSELLVLQRAKLHKLLSYAYENVPYYRRTFDRCGFQPDEVLVGRPDLSKIPVLTKDIIRQNFDEMLTIEQRRRAKMSRLATGGSTGRPLVFMQDIDFRDHVTADIHRHLGWAGWKFGQLHAYIWGANFEAAASQALRARLMNWALNRFVTNAYVLSEESMNVFAARVRRTRPKILFGYPSSLYRFAEFVRDNHMNNIRFDAVFASAEVLYPAQRQFIERILGGKTFNRYGTRELGGIGCECEAHTDMHASVDNVYIEILCSLDGGEPAHPGQVGHMVVTNLNNLGMPFIRYSLEDMGAWSTLDQCPCRRELPLMDLVQGRRIDMFVTQDGRTVWGGIGNPLWTMEGVRQFQLVQKALDHVLVRVVKDGPMLQEQRTQVERAAKTALGDNIRLEFEFPSEIPVEPSGKHRYQICEVDRSQYRSSG